MKPCITMFSDASVFPETGAAGWGFWIKGDGRMSLSDGGPLKETVKKSCIAELEAMANGLARAKAEGYFRPVDRIIMLQTDSTEALACLLYLKPDIPIRAHEESADIFRRKKPLDDRQKRSSAFILQTLDDLNLQPVLRHVRGHKNGGGRNWVNRLCDQLAKDGAKQARRIAA